MNRINRIFGALALLLGFAIASSQTPEPTVLEIVTQHHAFELSTTEIPSGWTTIRLSNESPVVHFAVLERLPDGRTLADSERDVVPVFQQAMDLIMEGETENGLAALGGLPEWYGGVVFNGGTGLVSPGEATEVVAFLEPGTYVVECYVKSADGTFHSSMGMVEELVVNESTTAAEPPAADVTITLTNPAPDDGSDPASGVTVDGDLGAGRQVVAVVFDEAEPPLLGNDLHLVRLGDGTDVAEVAAWMDWSSPTGLTEPAPATFLGGTQEMPRGKTAYVTVDLEPGRYAWVSERGVATPLYRTFEVR